MGLPGDHEGKTATRVFFVRGSAKIALVDSGLHGGLGTLKQAFRELDIERRDLDYLLLTHEHMDHVGNNGWIKSETGAAIMGAQEPCGSRGRQHVERQDNCACLP